MLIFRLIFFLSSFLDYRFPYCIQLYTWSTQQVIVAQHMCWFLKASNPPMFSPIEGSRVRQTPEEGQRTYRPKRCENSNKDEDNSPKNLNDKNQQASSQKFRQTMKFCFTLGKNVTGTYAMLQTAFRPSCMDWASVFEWHKRFKEGRESARHIERCERNKDVNTLQLIGQRVKVRVTMLRF